MECKIALERRKHRALTPYDPDTWETRLTQAGLIDRYPLIPDGLRRGFILNFPVITTTQTPPNKESIIIYKNEFQSIINSELQKQRYIGPCTAAEIETLIGPFQSSPLSIIPKPGKPGRFRVIQDYSFPHSEATTFPNPSINSSINPDDFPSTWGTFYSTALLISRLPPGSQIATRDVSEAYRTIPLHPSQWPGAVVRISDSEFCIDTCTCFGVSPSAGAYGHLADAGLDIFRSQGIGPMSRWVDDHLFFRIRTEFLEQYNEQRRRWHADITERGQHHDGGRIWFGGHIFDDGTVEQFDEDCRFPILDLSNSSPRSAEDKLFSFNFDDINRSSADTRTPWEAQKDANFAYCNPYIGLMWDLERNLVYFSDEKKAKYSRAVREWQDRTTHVLLDVQKLHGKLLNVSLVHPRGHAYLTSLEVMLRVCHKHPFLPHQPVKGLAEDMLWWADVLQLTFLGCTIPKPLTLHNPAAFSDASSGVGIAIIIGDKWRAWKLYPGWATLDGQKDIGWAEAVGFELLVRYIVALDRPERHFRVYGDNQGVIDGWKNGRSRNAAVNQVFRRIFEFLHGLPSSHSFHPTYVTSSANPADAPSRGIYADEGSLLTHLPIPHPLRRFIHDPFSPSAQP